MAETKIDRLRDETNIRVESLTNALHISSQVDSLNKTIGEVNNRIDILSKELTEVDKAVKNLQTQVADIDKRIKYLTKELRG
ncbi:MAG: hypothetical protein QW680_10730 [Pyrobaculum sp.]